ncbi:hypothetical protein HCG51_31510 [Tolypothrix sp. PCC 7910]|uniref:tetratricopeptide repeat protein n=1 Tax=Tolypothrix sp. PCC 7910 TaxID=2099387 RepID=UPI0014277853|nr:hypothetical protein [Tolypothrix sp. PCC 7910]QIR40777.1 hypothetical protein HCG51_31510 [Tolypothrix sp. PCC 7910]
MTEENRSVKVGGSADSSAIQTGTGNTATITITNYYYREDTTVVPIESTVAANENLPCPYRGLFHFGPDDAEFFFGREIFVEELFAATQNRNFIPVLGASGSGKSSVVLAGLVPKLQNEGHWLFTHFRPGSEPFYALALALVPLYTQNLDHTDKIIQARKLSQALGEGEIFLADVLAQIHQNHPTHRVLLIADQFEEIYTLCADHKVRHSFLDSLLASFPSSPHQSLYNHVLVATMRADFLGNALLYPPFGDVLKTDIKLRSMNHEELSQVIEKPADKLGVRFEVGLVERILDDVEDEPGNLPLLEFALTQLWQQRQGKLLTHAGYQHIGKVQGALARHADQNYGKLSATEKEQVRRIFIQLVHPGEGTQDTRRLATKAELSEATWGLVKQLADARLVVTSRNAAEQETVEVVHEALIRNWVELRQWMDADRSFRAWQERLRFAMDQWQKMQRDEGVLLRGAVLKEAEAKLKQRREELSKGEQEFIQASLALRQRGKQRIYYLFGGVSSILLLTLGIWGWLNYTTPGQLTQIRWKLTDVSQKVNSPEYQLKAVFAFARDENFTEALKLANQIQYSQYKVFALTAIAQAYGKLNQAPTAAPLLDKAISSANQIPDSDSKANALIAIAQAYGKLNQAPTAAPLLDKAIASANQIPDSRYKAYALTAIAQAYGKLNQAPTAAPLLNKAISSANQIPDSYNKAYALIAIAQAYGKLNQAPTAAPLLDKAISSANQIPDSRYKAYALTAIAQAYGKLNQAPTAAPLLDKVIASANQIQKSDEKAYALRAIAKAIGHLNQGQTAAPLLDKVIASANQIQAPNEKAIALHAIVEAIGQLKQVLTAAPLLDKAIASANQIQKSDLKAYALQTIAEAAAKLKNWGQALKATEKCPSDDCQVESLARVLTVHAEQQRPELKEEKEEEEE